MLGRFAEKYLSPSERLSEVMFGLIMVLTVTSTLSIALADGEGSRAVLIVGALGANAAWGIVDGVMYVLTSVLERGRHSRLVASIRSAKDRDTAVRAIEEDLDATMISVLDDERKKHIYEDVLMSAAASSPEEPRVTRDDVYGAIACFLLVFVSVLPLLVPFFLVNDLGLAIRASNLIAIVMLFAIGYETAKYTNKNRLKAGATMVLIGAAIVFVTVLLGG